MEFMQQALTRTPPQHKCKTTQNLENEIVAASAFRAIVSVRPVNLSLALQASQQQWQYRQVR
jgi:hypothetical protein